MVRADPFWISNRPWIISHDPRNPYMDSCSIYFHSVRLCIHYTPIACPVIISEILNKKFLFREIPFFLREIQICGIRYQAVCLKYIIFLLRPRFAVLRNAGIRRPMENESAILTIRSTLRKYLLPPALCDRTQARRYSGSFVNIFRHLLNSCSVY